MTSKHKNEFWRYRMMSEKIFKTMGVSGACSLAIGICILIGGIASGVLLIIQGAKLLAGRRNVTF